MVSCSGGAAVRWHALAVNVTAAAGAPKAGVTDLRLDRHISTMLPRSMSPFGSIQRELNTSLQRVFIGYEPRYFGC